MCKCLKIPRKHTAMHRIQSKHHTGANGLHVSVDEFSDSCFAQQVPVVSDRLLIKIISVVNGTTIAKSSKAAALNGICQWPKSILVPMWFSQDEVSKEFHERQCKIVVSMLKIRCLGARSKPRAVLSICHLGIICSGRLWDELSLRLDDCSPTEDDMGIKSDGSNSMLNKSAQSLSEIHLGSVYQDEAGNGV
ncbi:hypothetical protein BRADI_3g32706v3 [Brachypodium distachyon]|uniref:Uncharacterized protein n=1 Tax=Brachypodium distachyon TaxID=15368 RepID=A0A2K2D0N5_BRADI|nr:hypothetical protein BRADI_3g32706v3 [Brachypodium distachyon]